MFNYIKKQIANSIQAEPEPISAISSETILEYASLFQELDDLSEEGTGVDDDGDRSIDIPLEDSIDIDTIEINLSDNRISDIPADAAVQEAILIRTFDSFYQEACEVIQPFSHREPEWALDERRNNYAVQKHQEYNESMKLAGVSGFQTISVLDDSVPSLVKIDFGDIKSGLPVSWGMSHGGMITKRQLDTLQVCESYFGEKFTNTIELYQEFKIGKSGAVIHDGFSDALKSIALDIPTLGLASIIRKKNFMKKDIKNALIANLKFFQFTDAEMGQIKAGNNILVGHLRDAVKYASKSENIFSSEVISKLKELHSRLTKKRWEEAIYAAIGGFVGNKIGQKAGSIVSKGIMIPNLVTQASAKVGSKIGIAVANASDNAIDDWKQLQELAQKIIDMVGKDESNDDEDEVRQESVTVWDNIRPIKLCIPSNDDNTFKASLVVESFETGELNTYEIEVSPEAIQEAKLTKHTSGVPDDTRTKKEYQETYVKSSRPSRFGMDDITIQEGLFPKKIDIRTAPVDVTMSLNKDVDVKVSFMYHVVGNDKIYQRQADCAREFATNLDRQQSLLKYIENAQMDKYAGRVGKKETIWDISELKYIIVPYDKDRYTRVAKDMGFIVIKVENKYSNDPFYYSIEWKLNPDAPGSRGLTCKLLSTKAFESSVKTSDLKKYKKSFDIIQEGIDFGDGGGDPNQQQPQQPTVDNAQQPNPVDNMDQQQPEGASPQQLDANAKQVDTNDVSDEIAQNVADVQAGNENLDSSELELGGDGDNGDMEDFEFNTNDDPETQLEDLDKTATEEMELDSDADPTNTNNMTINQLLKAGEVRLKNMTTEELQSFIGDMGAEAIDADDDEETQVEFATELLANVLYEYGQTDLRTENVLQEAVFLNKKNIKKEMKEKLAISLGILNGELELVALLQEFKKSGKPLNRVLSKAGKMKKVFSEEERTHITSINKVLADLMSTIKTDKKPTEGESQVLRRLLKEFVSQSKVIDRILERDDQDKEEKNV